MNKKPRPVHTIGHSDMGREKLIDRLEQYGIQLVVGVRSMPHSRHAPQFNREELAGALGQRGIGYIHMEDELGGRPTEDRLYEPGRHPGAPATRPRSALVQRPASSKLIHSGYPNRLQEETTCPSSDSTGNMV